MSAAEALVSTGERRRGLVDGAWALLGQVGSGLLLLAGTRLTTELVPPEVYGQVALFNGLVGLGVTLLAYPLVSAAMRLLPEYQYLGGKNAFIGGLHRLMGIAMLLACLLYASGAGLYLWQYRDDALPWLAAGALLVVTMQRELGIHLLIGERRQREASLWQTADSLLRPTLAILLVWSLGAQAHLVLAGYALAGLLGYAWSGRNRTANAYSPETDGAVRRDILRYALPLLPMELMSWFNALGDRYVVGYYLGPQDVGLYAAVYTLTNEAFHRAAIVLLRSYQPVYFADHSHRRTKQATKTWWLWILSVVVMGAAGVTALFWLKDWVVGLLLAPAYRAGAELMPVIGLGCALQALATVMAQPLYARKATRRLIPGRLAGTLTAVIALPWLVSSEGLMGAATAAPVYFGVEALAMGLMARPWRGSCR
ncbi:lipopolysaccharide biosynthesis protein [Methylococcus sp. EFPC2]|uniref:lipopolysaccharide biosynthesis protein n=1 Tax=Methylococcus sp. EFPC2 TaxID=2812648 RepID=UPI00196855CD|nr:lipopolysaccharide biosynthesis protein [Methylococcus sp. EFPC2]QSA98581.1 lipopolysaccharide biosynthesis protein [Methylococcus sp. EFPC2]